MNGRQLLELLRQPDWRAHLEGMDQARAAQVLAAEQELPFAEYTALPDWQSREAFLSALSGKKSWERQVSRGTGPA